MQSSQPNSPSVLPPASIALEDAPCPAGCSRNDEPVLRGGDLLHSLPGQFDVVRCCSCGLMRTNPRPTAQTIGFYYPAEYGPYASSKVSEAASTSPKRVGMLKRLVQAIFDFRGEKLPQLPPGNLLEIGCASGSFLHRMAAKGWQVEGIEFSRQAADAASRLGYKVHCGSLETAPITQAHYDLMVGWMVLEHLHDPVGCLQKLRRAARPGAWLALSVPNAGSCEFRLFKTRWYALQLPTHLYHYTPRTLGNILDASGWSIEKVYHQRTIGNLIASFGYVLRDRGFHKIGIRFVDFAERGGRWNYLLFPVAFVLGALGQTGRITIWAKAQ